MSTPDLFPEWLTKDLIELSSIEPLLFPNFLDDQQFPHYPPIVSDATKVFFQLKEALDANAPRILFLVPWIKRGGADLVTIRHVEAMVELGVSCAVMLTNDDDSPWADRLPSCVSTIEFGKITRHLIESDQRIILTQLLLNSSLEAVHIINSFHGWQSLEMHGKAFQQVGLKVFASVYGDEVDSLGNPFAFAAESLPKCLEWLHAIITDSVHFSNVIQYRDGFPAERLFPVYNPSPETPDLQSLTRARSSNPHVLWASRMTESKLPQILADIIEATPELTFHVFGEADASISPAVIQRLIDAENCLMYGTYDSFSAVCHSRDFGAFLYTSSRDGLPNVLLEAISKGLPVLAPAVGGVPELINDQTGYLISDFSDISAYHNALLEIVNVPETSQAKALNAMKLVQKRHSMNAFIHAIKKIPGYPSNVTDVS